ncbi:hypothetical protein RRG08_045762 [Elysia crispata]|uniref:MRH domain-containing protein n=1 Tax=Elysia crispata TaxID=231223 RepID=A0AAE1E716_9GAST|nr:hypothetical protein RRG08_045762 [Elysia crispata]
MEELKSVYYGLDILKEPVSIAKEVPSGAVYVTSKYGQQYQCTFPDHSSEEKRKEEEEKIAMETGIVEMLRPMSDKPCLFKAKDWWSYEFCYGKYIRQFHMEDGDIRGNVIYLGYYQDDFNWNNETARDARLKSKTGQSRYHSQKYTLGTKCDLTGEMRQAEVRFLCEENSEDYLSRVDESETCVYTVTVMTSRICRHPYLKAPARRKPVPITCNPLLSEEQFQSYLQEVEEANQRKQLRRLKEAEAEVLEDQMSKRAKELLSQPVEELFTNSNKDMLRKEVFEKIFGQDETLWKAYLHHMQSQFGEQEVQRRKLREIVEDFKKVGQGNEEHTGQREEDKVNDDGEAQVQQRIHDNKNAERDEDDEILSEFDKEIKEIKARFGNSQKSIAKIKRKLALDKRWEAEIQEAIKEAERELGVKVDNNVISGLSNTLDKLVSKLQDTETELASAGKELGKLKPGKSIVTNKKATGVFDDDSDDEDEEEDVDKVIKNGASNQQETDIKIQAPPRTDPEAMGSETTDDSSVRYDRPPTREEEEQTGSLGPDTLTGDDISDNHPAGSGVGAALSDPSSTNIAPAVENPVNPEDVSDVLDTGGAPNDGAVIAGDNGEEEEDAEVTVTLRKTDNTKPELPENVQKLLEDSIKKEYKKNRLDDDSQPLSFDTDHSFQRDRTVHVIQSEDEEGKTNRYIFIFGFNNFNDESAEKQRQSQLEENYGFVYSDNKNKKSLSSGTGS